MSLIYGQPLPDTEILKNPVKLSLGGLLSKVLGELESITHPRHQLKGIF